MAANLPKQNNFQVHFFKTKRPIKRLREEQDTPQIKVDDRSCSNFGVIQPLHQLPPNNAITHSKNAEYLAFQLDRLRDKEGRYVNHKLFLSRCISENAILNGLRVELEPTIENHDETFLNNWYEKMQQHSLRFMKGIIIFCDKTITELKAEIKNIYKILISSGIYNIDQGKLNSIHHETKSPPTKIKLQKKDKFRTRQL